MHPEAQGNYDAKAQELVDRVREVPEEFKHKRTEQNPNIHIDQNIPSEDLIGEITHGWFDQDGNVIAEAFDQPAGMFGLIDTLILYSRSSLAKEIADKLVYILVALESIFLKGNEPIQDNLSLRMAFMHDVSIEDRRAIRDNIKHAYQLRSSFIHHGKRIGVDDHKTLRQFMLNAWRSLAALIPIARTETTKDQFYEWLEDRRLSG